MSERRCETSGKHLAATNCNLQPRNGEKNEKTLHASNRNRPCGPSRVPDDRGCKKKDEFAATPNLSFPLIATDILQMFYLQT